MAIHAVTQHAIYEMRLQPRIEGYVRRAIGLVRQIHIVRSVHQVVSPHPLERSGSPGGIRSVARSVVPPIGRPDPVVDFLSRQMSANEGDVVTHLQWTS